ncbi:MAG: VOC family protein [Spirochaetota bacterium]
MQTEVIGIDHVYVSVRSLPDSERFYDVVLAEVLGFRKNAFVLKGNPHVQYFNRHFGYVIRQARNTGAFDSESPGLHHFCFRVTNEADVDRVAERVRARGFSVSIPQYHREYAPDYYAVYLTDPDGVRLEVTNFRQERRERMQNWENQVP